MVGEKQQEQSIELKVSDAGMDHQPVLDLGERYEVVSQIGTGGMAVVYKIREVATGKFFAAKVLKADFASDESTVNRFRHEAALVKQLEHPHIVKVKDYTLTRSGVPVLIMDWSDGETLADRIKTHGPVPAVKSISIFAQICRALTYAHGLGIIHRDIKPSNIFLVDNDGEPFVKIMDFGIAKILEKEQSSDNSQTQSGAVLGSPAYMSPEQCLGERVDARSDLYSLGCVMYETLTGHNPFIAPNPVATLLKHLESEPPPLSSEEFATLRIPGEMEAVVARCLAKDPAARYQTAKNVEEELFPQPSPIRSLVAAAIDLVLACFTTQIIQHALSLAGNDIFALHPGLWMQLGCIVYVLYCTLFEASPLRRTLGKAIAGIKVVGSDGDGAPLLSGLGVSLSTYAVFVLLLTFGSISTVALAVDHAFHTWYTFLSDFTWCVLAAFWIYMVYLFGFIYRRKKQAHIDTFFGRRIILRKLSSLYDSKKRRKTLRKRESVAVLVSLLIVAIVPQLRDHAVDAAWGDPAVIKDMPLGVKEDVPEGALIAATNLTQIPVLRTGRGHEDNAVMTESTVVGKSAASRILSGQPIRISWVNGFDKSEFGSPYWSALGREQAASGDNVQAELSFQRSLKSNRRDREALLGLAQLYEKDGRHQKAAEYRDAAVRAVVLPNAVLAEKLNDLKQWEEAYAVARRSVLATPDDVKSLRQLEIATEHMNAYHTNAEATLRIANLRQNRVQHLQILVKRGQLDAAVTQAILYINRDNEDPWLYWQLGEILKRKGDNVRAIEFINKAVALDEKLAAKRDAFVARLKK